MAGDLERVAEFVVHAHRLVRAATSTLSRHRRSSCVAERRPPSPSSSTMRAGRRHVSDLDRVVQPETAYEHRAVLGDHCAQGVCLQGASNAGRRRVGRRAGSVACLQRHRRQCLPRVDREVIVISSELSYSWDTSRRCLVGKNGMLSNVVVGDGTIQGDRQLHRGQRRASSVEEVVVAADVILRECRALSPRQRQAAARSAWQEPRRPDRRLGVRWHVTSSDLRSTLPFAVSGSFVESVQHRGNHVCRQ